MYVYEVAVRLDRKTARDVALFALRERGFGIEWQSPWSAVADKGSSRANYALGALAPHVVFGLVVFDVDDDDVVVIRLERFRVGWVAGPWTAARVLAQFTRLGDALVAAARKEGVLVNVTRA